MQAAKPAAGASEAGAVWFYMDNYRQRQGPITRAALDELFLKAEVSVFTMGWKEGLSGWMPLGDVPELQDTFVVTEEVCMTVGCFFDGPPQVLPEQSGGCSRGEKGRRTEGKAQEEEKEEAQVEGSRGT